MIDPLAACGVCPTCRRVIPLARPCDDGATPLVPLDAAQRRELVRVVWGDDAQRRALLATSHRTASARVRAGAMTAVATGGAAALGNLPAVAVAVFGAIGAAFGALINWSGRRVLIPAGGVATLARPRVGAGRIEDADELIAPGSGEVCAGWALELRFELRGRARTLLRIGATAGIELELDGGARVRIPAGPLAITDGLTQLGDLEDSLEDLIRDLDPRRAERADPWPLFPFNVVVERALHIGDRVSVFGELAPAFTASETGVLYRDAPATVLVPVGVPTLS